MLYKSVFLALQIYENNVLKAILFCAVMHLKTRTLSKRGKGKEGAYISREAIKKKQADGPFPGAGFFF